jgi:hypothetical protein
MMRAPTATTLREAADAFIAGARDGTILTRTGLRYRPSVVRSYLAGAPPPHPARVRRTQAERRQPLRPTGPRRPPARAPAQPVNIAEHLDAAAGDLPSCAQARRRGDQPDERPRDADRGRSTRPDRVAARSCSAARCATAGEASALGDPGSAAASWSGSSGRTSTSRAAGSASSAPMTGRPGG